MKDMILALFALSVIGLIVFAAEIMWHIRLLRREAGRKFIHILSAIWVAFWPFFLSFQTITLLSIVLLVGVVVTRKLKVGRSIHSIERLTSGDILFPVGIVLASLLTTNKWLFCASLLHIGLADGLAGLIGRHYNLGKYKILGNTKSVLGTATFAVVSIAILVWLFKYSEANLPLIALPFALILVPPITAFAENISPRGSDNISVPLLTSLLLELLV